MKIGLIGYGRMGLLIEERAPILHHEIVWIATKSQPLQSLDEALLKQADAVIDFSRSDAVLAHIEFLSKYKLPTVIGTTGWEKDLDIARQYIDKEQSAALYAPNFSLGMALFLELIKEAAQLVNGLPDFDVAAFEHHHAAKKDAPSGSAKQIAEVLLHNLNRKTQVSYDKPEKPLDPETFHFASLRGGFEPGMHQVTLDAPLESVTLTHRVRSREVFADGAIQAAVWLKERKGFYLLEDMLKCLVSKAD